ncbi:MAG: hypothetical protein V4508_07550 [Pseudomonadota bacterium]
MTFALLRHLKYALALALLATLPALATPLMEMRAEDLMAMAPDLKKALALNPNQLLLWQQTESKSHALLRERQSRRERLQAHSKTALEGANVELRELGAVLDAEAASGLAEEKQLREWWLTVNDALDENQRRMVASLVAEQMMKVADGGAQRSQPRGKEDGGSPRRGGMGRNKPGSSGM